MCCFSANVESVSNTRIFARPTGRNTQVLAYQMRWVAKKPLAMILPLPVIQDKPNAVRFIDLKGYATFFDDLNKGFPAQPPSRGGAGAKSAPAAAPDALPVEEVGDFVASFVPTQNDFDRLDKRFVIPKEIWAQIPSYARYGFAVFQLKPDAKNGASVHPMALEFDTRMAASLFFPTVHIHDGEVHPRERFDHVLYAQEARIGAETTKENAEKFMAIDKAQKLINPKKTVSRLILRGTLRNRDSIFAL